MRATALAAGLGLVVVVALAAAGQSANPLPKIADGQLSVDERVLLAGVPDLEQLRQLPPATTVVVDLRTAAEGIEQEAAMLRERGYEYHNIPVAGATIDAAQLDQLRALAAANAANPDQMLIVHCRSGNRAAMLWGAYLLEQGQSLDQTMQTVGPGLTSDATRKALLDFSEDRNNPHTP